MPPLPRLTPFNEWFWTSGADGRLRIQRCRECATFVHPPVPVCPSCRSRSWEAAPVSGRATVVGFTVNAHQWLPVFEPTGGTDPVERVAEPERSKPRPPAQDDRFEHRSVISGVGRSAIGRRLMVDPLSLTVDACLTAIADAGLTPDA